MNRLEMLLGMLRATPGMRVEDAMRELDITRRTLRSDLTKIQQQLGTAARIVDIDGSLQLLVADPKRFRAVRHALAEDATFNNPEHRADHILGRLFRSAVPLTIDTLASDMAVGRTTLANDLAFLRERIEKTDVTLAGRQNVGVWLEGDEFSIRLLVLRLVYPTAYPEEPWHVPVRKVVERHAEKAGLETSLAADLARWAIVAIDRNSVGNGVVEVPSRFEGLRGTAAHTFSAELLADLADTTSVPLADEEQIFLALPIAGMRAPTSIPAAARFMPPEDDLADAVFTAIHERMDIDLRGSKYRPAFARHLNYLVTRLRYGLWVDYAHTRDMVERFPVAYRMTTLAAEVIEARLGLKVNQAECELLTMYFQLFVESTPKDAPELRVIVSTSSGRATGELLRIQVAKLLPPETDVQLLGPDESPEMLENADLLVVTEDVDVEVDVPTVVVTEEPNAQLLKKELARVPLGIGLQQDDVRSVLGAALHPRRFFALPAGTTYHEALEFVGGHLQAAGDLPEDFTLRLLEREQRASMVVTQHLAFPHIAVPGLVKPLFAVAVVPREPREHGPSLIALLAIPAPDDGRGEAALIQMYDAVLRLATHPDLLLRLGQVKDFEGFYYLLENTVLIEGSQ